MLILSHFIFKKYIYLTAHISKHLFLHFSYTISYTLTTIFHTTQYTITHLMFILSLSLFGKYIYLAAHISKHLFLHPHVQNLFSQKATYTIPYITKHRKTPLLILCSFSHSPYSENTSILLPIFLNISFSISLTKSHILESNTSYYYNLSNSFNIIPLPSYISLIYLTNYISHKLSIHIPHIYYKPISHRISIFITHTYYKYTFHKISIFYHLHTSQEISNTHTKSPSLGRHKLLILKPFSQKIQILIIKALLIEGIDF